MNGPRKPREPESITAPPQSSDEEEDYRHDSDSDDDDADADNRYKDIRPTRFSNAQSSPQTSGTRQSTREKSKPQARQRSFIRSSQKDTPSSSASSKRSAEDIAPGASDHLKDPFGFSKNKKTNSVTYGKPPQSKSSQGALRKSRSKFPAQHRENNAGRFSKRVETSPDPKDIRPFMRPESLSPEKIKPSKTFVRPPSLSGSSPIRDIKKPVFRNGSLSPDESPSQNQFKRHDLDESGVAVEAKTNSRPGRIKKSTVPKTKRRKLSQESVADEFLERPSFKLHALDDLDDIDDLDTSDGNVFSMFESKGSDDEIDDVSMHNLPNATAKCPMCHEAVDAELLKKHSDHGRMSIKKQTAFCRLHKRRAAMDSGSRKGYPGINWKTLDKRLDKHQDLLKEILEGTRQSHYREVLRENVEMGKNRTLLKTDDSLTPGYYGPRGLRVMTEYIMRTLSSIVRKRAVEDRLVSARGYTGYVQTVLVPELAVRLIMEDMDVAEEDARNVMLESIEVGELLYEDAGDVIAGVSDEEDMP
ncbi:RTC4-like domain-containing protein [Daldinia sp. FL1419]|nr:RTC4-like domain-containing protein [Daldinia sp. FL1419]